MSSRFSPRALLALALLAIPACGSAEEGYHFTVHPADGTVLLKDKPLPRAIVRFHPTDPATVKIPDGQTGPPVMLTTETDADGKFSMSTYLADDGVPAGDYVVTVIMARDETDLENSDGQSAKNLRRAAEGDIYRQPSTTPLKATVKPGENHFTFEMK